MACGTNVVALRPHQTFQTSFEVRSQGSTLHGPKGDQQQSPLGSPLPFRQHFRYLQKTTAAKKSRRKLIEFLTAYLALSAHLVVKRENANASDGASLPLES